jgi:hypothetical protein
VLAWAQTPGLACPHGRLRGGPRRARPAEPTSSAATADASMHLRDHHCPRCWLPC